MNAWNWPRLPLILSRRRSWYRMQCRWISNVLTNWSIIGCDLLLRLVLRWSDYIILKFTSAIQGDYQLSGSIFCVSAAKCIHRRPAFHVHAPGLGRGLPRRGRTRPRRRLEARPQQRCPALLSLLETSGGRRRCKALCHQIGVLQTHCRVARLPQRPLLSGFRIQGQGGICKTHQQHHSIFLLLFRRRQGSRVSADERIRIDLGRSQQSGLLFVTLSWWSDSYNYPTSICSSLPLTRVT